MKLKHKILIPIVILTLAVIAKFVLMDFPISTGKRTGNLVKISKKGKVLKTWEGTLDEGSGDKLTFYFSVKNNDLATEMFNYEGKQVSIFYEQYLVGWPRETSYNVTKWTPKEGLSNETDSISESGDSSALKLLNKTLFCSVLGSLYTNQELYKKVKTHLKENNLYLYRQIEKCND